MSATIHRWVLIRSWHRISHADTPYRVVTRCGRRARVVGTTGPIDGPGEPQEVHGTSETLPLDEPSCEICLRLTAHDAEPQP